MLIYKMMDKIIDYFKNLYGKTYSEEEENAPEAISVANLTREQRDELRSRLFNEARAFNKKQPGDEPFLWLENCLDLIEKHTFRFHRVYFSPGTDIPEIINDLLDQAKHSLDLCVFTITDDRLVSHIFDALKRGIKIRIITDDRKIFDHGSAIQSLQRASIPVKIDHSQYHMHHKFGIIDKKIAFTGSFNWTYTASKHNQENLLVTSKYDLVRQYLDEFEKLWVLMYPL